MEKSLLEKKFKDVEKKLRMLLKHSQVEFSDSDDEKTIKQNIKGHIETLKQIENLFDEYENLAKLLFKVEDEDDLPALEKQENKIIKEENNIKANSKKCSKKKILDSKENLSAEILKNA